MNLGRSSFLALAGAGVAAPAVARVAWGQTPQVTLKLHHFVPPMSNPHQKLFIPWVKKIEADSGNRIKIDMYPAMQLGGTPPQLYDQARDGVVDIAWTLPGSTPGRFPSIEVFELPFVAARLAKLIEAEAVDWTQVALQIHEAVRAELDAAAPAFLATWLGRYADLAALMVRRGLLPMLTPIVPPNMTLAEIEDELRGTAEKRVRDSLAGAMRAVDATRESDSRAMREAGG